MRKRVLPSPVLTVALFVLWLLLNPWSPGTAVVAAVVAVVVPMLTGGLRPSPARLHHPLRIVRLIAVVAFDMTRAAFRVWWLLLTRRSAALPSAFVRVPLEITDPNALAGLAIIVCATPGTAWAELSADRKVLMLHVLEVQDEAAEIAWVKRRYERPLKEIFE
jgi:multicomponent K+:H+ antiporter subunit E